VIRRALLLSGLAAAAWPASAQVIWLKVPGPDNSFHVEMPGTPEYKIATNTVPGGTQTYQYHSFSLQRGPTQYVTQSALLPPPIDVSNPRKVLQEYLDGAARSLVASKWQQVNWTKLAGAEAGEARGAFDDRKSLRYLLVLKERRLVVMGLSGPPGTEKFPDSDRFFKSLAFSP
jgi:hypothetical protein